MGTGSVHDVYAQTPQQYSPTSQAPKKVLKNDPVGNLFNDGPRVVYTQDADADPIEKLFWDRELKKEKIRVLKESQELPSASPTAEPEPEPPASSKKLITEPAEPEVVSPRSPDQTTARGVADANTGKAVDRQQTRSKKDAAVSSTDKSAISPKIVKQPPHEEAQATPQQTAKPSADAGRVDGVSINGAMWPIATKPKNAYGKPGPEGRPWQGLVFDVPTGTPVKAIDSGRVMYAHDFKNYGNLVIIDHGDRVASVYANNQKLLVKEGAQVGTGDVIALSGQTGSLNYPALYFEIRKEGKPVDPIQFLKRR